MKLTVFQSTEGDCVLLTSADGKMVLADGGKAQSYSKHVAPFLGAQLTAGKKLETAYISHIDADHIEGILQMLDDLVAWGVFDFQQAQGNNKFKQPKSIRPMKPKNIWHNSFHEQVPDNAGRIADLLAASSAVLSGADLKQHLEMAAAQQDIATSMRQAVNVSRRIGQNQLNIKLNPEFGGKLMTLVDNAPAPPPIKTGKMKWHIIGPFEKDLAKLRDEWNAWLEKSEDFIEKVKRDAARDEENLGNAATEVSRLIGTASVEARLLAQAFLNEMPAALATKKLGVREKVTTPNLASLMFLVEEGVAAAKQRVLMTGDGHWEDILKGLGKQNKLDAAGNIHLDVLKVQHHGSEHNINRDFLKQVTADHYVFCGNGKHENPDLDVVKAVLDSRLVAKHQGSHANVGNKFKLWFNSNSKNPDAETADNAHMKKVEKIVTNTAAANPGSFTFFFLTGSSFDVKL